MYYLKWCVKVHCAFLSLEIILVRIKKVIFKSFKFGCMYNDRPYACRGLWETCNYLSRIITLFCDVFNLQVFCWLIKKQDKTTLLCCSFYIAHPEEASTFELSLPSSFSLFICIPLFLTSFNS